jgi:argininosuccinate lyase
LQEDKRHIFAAFDVTSASLAMAAAIVSSARYVRANIEPTLDRGFLDATSLAEYFVRQGIAFRTAHQIVGQLVRRCEAEGKPRLADLTLEEITATAGEHAPAAKIDSELFESLGPANVVRRYRSPGAAGGEPLRHQLAEMKRRLRM